MRTVLHLPRCVNGAPRGASTSLTSLTRPPYLTGVRTLTLITSVSLLLLAACSGGRDNFTFRLLIVEQPQTGGAPETFCGAAPAATAEVPQNRFTLRFTFMRADAGGEAVTAERLGRHYSIVCDRVVASGEAVDLQVPFEAGKRFSVRVEAFDPTAGGALALSGQAEAVDLDTESATVYLKRTKTMSCVGRMNQARAFHSATLLPNGEVLVAGGVVAEATSTTQKLHVEFGAERAYVSGKVEVFNPKTLAFTTLSSTMPARAFHRAHLLPSPLGGPYRVLLVGGVQAAKETDPAFRLRVSTTSLPFLFSPASGTTAAPVGVLTYAPAQGSTAASLTYSAVTSLASVKAMFPATVSLPGKGVLVLGGGASYSATGGVGKDEGFGRADAVLINTSGNTLSAKAAATDQIRVGHAAAALSPARALVLGGNMSWECGNTAASCDQKVAETVTAGAGDTLSAAVQTFTPGPPTLAWHTLTPLGLSDAQLYPQSGTPAPLRHLLWAGGFGLKRETSVLRADDQTPQIQTPLREVKLAGGQPSSVTALASPGSFQAVGHHAALRLADGRVLLSGGNADPGALATVPQRCKDPQTGTGTTFCPFGQLAVYALTNNAVGEDATAAGQTLRLPRFGHRMTRLLDNTALITGGVTYLQGQPLLADYAELFNPRLGNAGEDPFGREAGKDYDATTGESGHSCTPQEE